MLGLSESDWRHKVERGIGMARAISESDRREIARARSGRLGQIARDYVRRRDVCADIITHCDCLKDAINGFHCEY